MRVLLIAPGKDAHYSKRMSFGLKFPPLNMATIAGLTKPGIDIKILDENVEQIDYNDGADIVGITVMTTVAPRAYKIAEEFRRRGAKVVLGGSHVTALPEEAMQYCDSVVIGEAEGSWPRLIEDFEKNNLQKFYKNETRSSLEGLPDPRRDLYKKGAYLVKETFQTTRGCPFACNFCSVSNFFGKTYRSRPAKDVVRDIKERHAKFLGFIDDNIAGNKAYCKRLFEALIPLKIKWVGQASTTIVNDPELLKLAEKSGCCGLFVGFESVSTASLAEMTKVHNVNTNYKDVVSKLHDHGINVMGAFIFGLDNDDASIFERTVDYIKKIKIDLVQFTPLTPLPGTVLYKKLNDEGRITERDWKKYDMEHIIYKPAKMTADELLGGSAWAWREFYSTGSIFKRLINSRFSISRAMLYFVPLLIMNFGFRQTLEYNNAMDLYLKGLRDDFKNVQAKLKKLIKTDPKIEK